VYVIVMDSRIYPPSLADEHLENLICTIQDWQLSNGSLLKVLDSDIEEAVLAYPVGVSLFPTLFPKQLFDEALALQEEYNRLYTAVAEDADWLHSNLESMIKFDLLAGVLWGIHKEVEQSGYVQDLTLGVFRSDYMLHAPPNDLSEYSNKPQLKQVEFNTVSCAGGVHGNKVSRMHRYLHQTGAYDPQGSSSKSVSLVHSALPLNSTIKTIAAGLAAAHREYGKPKCSKAAQTCVLFVVQAPNFNIADERPIEYALWEQDPPVPSFRVHFGQGIFDSTILTSTRELLFQPPNRSVSVQPVEVSVIYMRSGFEIYVSGLLLAHFVETVVEIGPNCSL
jgi:glutathione synthetase